MFFHIWRLMFIFSLLGVIDEQLNFLGYGYGYGWDTHNRQYIRQPYIEIKFLLFLHVFSLISNEYDKIKCLKPEYFGCLGYIVSYGYPYRNHTRGNSVVYVC
jgi:hypothetical protein